MTPNTETQAAAEGTTQVASRAPLAEVKAEAIATEMAKYPSPRSAVMALLFMVQELDGHITPPAVAEVAEICGMQPSEVSEVVTFYTMYFRDPVGKNILWVCGTLPCALCGADGLFDYLKEKLGVGLDEVTPDGLFTIKRMECLGACSEAPLMLINEKMATKLNRAKVDELIERMRNGETWSDGSDVSDDSDNKEETDGR